MPRQKHSRILGLLLLLTYIGYFGSSHFFVHQHKNFGYVVVHSHPFANPSHSHSNNEYQVLDQLGNDVCLLPTVISPVDIIIGIDVQYVDSLQIVALSPCHYLWATKAPPLFSFEA